MRAHRASCWTYELAPHAHPTVGPLLWGPCHQVPPLRSIISTAVEVAKHGPPTTRTALSVNQCMHTHDPQVHTALTFLSRKGYRNLENNPLVLVMHKCPPLLTGKCALITLRSRLDHFWILVSKISATTQPEAGHNIVSMKTHGSPIPLEQKAHQLLPCLTCTVPTES